MNIDWSKAHEWVLIEPGLEKDQFIKLPKKRLTYRRAKILENGDAVAGRKYERKDTLLRIGSGYDTTDWQNSLIERQEVSNRVEQLRSVEAARQVEATLAERQNQYGDFKDVAHLSQGLQSLLSVGNFSDTQQEAIQMICSKLARLACGDADHVDSWHDIAGYATLVVKDLESAK
jgi:hypothetical protein